jgi:hypothetical protein
VVDLASDHEDLLVQVCDGNPGALRLCIELVHAGHLGTVKRMLQLGITGPRVWLAFKDLGDSTLERLVETIESADLIARLTDLGYAPQPKAEVSA